jgi:hypothetical protein
MKGNWWNRLFILLFLLFAFLSVTPGFYFREHYFVTLLPAVGIFAALPFELLNSLLKKYFKYIPVITGLVFVIIIYYGINTYNQYFFNASPADLCNLIYHKNNFNEAIPVAKYIQTHSNEDDTIFVFGSEPEILFYSKRFSATGYIYMYDLVVKQKYQNQMRLEMINEVEKSKPKYIVIVSSFFSWLPEEGQADTLFKWIRDYAQKFHYMQVGLVENHFPEPSIYVWDNDALTFQRTTNNYISLYRRPD